MRIFFRRLLCSHSFYNNGSFNVFRQSPFHEFGIGWMYRCERKKCIKCGTVREVIR